MTSTDHTQDQAIQRKKSTSDICPICYGTGWELNKDTGAYKRCSCFEKERIDRLWKRYGVDPAEIKKIKEYEAKDNIQKSAKEKAINYIKNFEKIKNERENAFGLFGQPGAGKTHIINAIGAALINQGIEVIYMPYVEVLRELKANAMDDEYYTKLSSRYQRTKVLIIDDLFKDKFKNCKLVGSLTETDMKHIYPIINFRYSNKLPTLISTEATPETLANLDEALAGRIIETCGDNITVFEGSKYNYRMRKFVK